MGKSWKRRQQRLRNRSAKKAVDHILTTTASMSRTIDEVINTMKPPVEQEPAMVEPIVTTATPAARRARKRRVQKTTTATIIDSNETTD